MKNFTHYILFLLLILGQQHVQSQCINLAVSAGSGANYSSTQLYSENFSGQNNKGALHTGTDLTGVDWTVDVSSATLSNTNDFFKIENEVLKQEMLMVIVFGYLPLFLLLNMKMSPYP